MVEQVYWHPFSDMGAVRTAGELVLASGEGAWVTDDRGRRYLDATASLWYCNVGHGRAELADAAAAQMRVLAAYSNFGDMVTAPTLELADRLSALAPLDGAPARPAKVFFTSGGSDSVDTATKLARRYWQVVGRPTKTHVLSRQQAYHGMHVAGTSLAGIAANREGYGPPLMDTTVVTWDDADALADAIDALGPENVAAFFCEPVIGAGGVFPPPKGYLRAAREVCRERDVLFVADEVVTGLGRMGGDWFAAHRYDLSPDLITCAKGLTSGYLPLGAVVVAARVAEPFFEPAAGVWWRHGYTYSGHATACAVALANLDILEREKLLLEAARLEATLARELTPLAEHPLVSEVRCGAGALAAVQFAPDALIADPGVAQKAVLALRERGVLTRVLAPGALQVSPSFVMTDDEVTLLATATREALDALP